MGGIILSEKIGINTFTEILNKSDFNNKFNLQKDYNINDLASKTLEFIDNNRNENTHALNQLVVLLKSSGISVQSYFNFIETIRELSFDDKEYRNFLSEEYRQLFKTIDETNISDLDKLISKIGILEQAEKSKDKSETKNMIGKTIVYTTAIIGGTIVACKALETHEKVTKAAATASNVKNICDVVTNVVTAPFKLLK